MAFSLNAVRVGVADHFGSAPSNKAAAVALQIEELLPQVRQGRPILFDFVGIEFVGQAFAGALTSVLREELGAEFVRLVHFENASPVVASVLASVSLTRKRW